MLIRRNSKYYQWIVVAVCFLLQFVAMAFCSGTKGLFLFAITDALQIKRALFSVGDTIRFISSAVLALFFGSLFQRFGTKKLLTAGFLCLIVSMTVHALATNIWLFYLGGCLLGLGLGTTTATMVTVQIRGWCDGPHVGKLLGLVLGANGIGGAVASKVLTPIIYREGDVFGYRKAYLIIIPMLIVTGLLAVLVLNDPPEGRGASHGKKVRGSGWAGMDYTLVRRKPYFYVVLLTVFLTGMILQSMTGVSVAHMKDSGISPDYVATVWSIHSLVLACAKFLAGACYDRFGLRTTMLIGDGMAVSSLALLSVVSGSSTGCALAMIYGIISSLALTLETIMLSLITRDLFGDTSFTKLLGIVTAVNTAGFAVGAPVLNWCFDRWGSYSPAFRVFAGVMAVVTVLFQLSAAAAGRDRRALEQSKAPAV